MVFGPIVEIIKENELMKSEFFNRSVFIICLNLVLLNSSWASVNSENANSSKETEKVDSSDKKEPSSSSSLRSESDKMVKLPTINESWYIFFDTGVISSSSSGEVERRREDINKVSTGNDGKTMGGLNLSLAFYFPANGHKTMFGPSFSFGASSYNVVNESSQEFDISNSHADLAFSIQHYFGVNIGSGFFIRGDAGLSRVNFSVKHDDFCFFDCDTRSSIEFRDGEKWTFNSYGEEKSVTAISALASAGFGYSFGLGSKLRMQVLLSHTLRPSRIGNMDSTKLALGMLF